MAVQRSALEIPSIASGLSLRALCRQTFWLISSKLPGRFPGPAPCCELYDHSNGGAGFSATLRLHYLDAELNGNTETQLGLFRNTHRG